MKSLCEPLLYAGLTRCETVFASGREANNKLELDYEKINRERPALAYEVIRRLGVMAAEYGPDLIVPVPTGANDYGMRVSNRRGVDCVYFEKDADSGAVYYSGNVDNLLDQYNRIIIIEDVLNRRTTARKVIDVLGASDKIKAVLGVFDRGNPADRLELPDGIKVASLAAVPIAEQLLDDSILWRFAQ